MIQKQVFKLTVALLALCVFDISQARATDGSLYNTKGTWHFAFSGIPFAKLWIASQEHDGTFAITAAFKSTGLVRVFKKMKSLTTANGVWMNATPQTLTLRYSNNDEGKKTALDFTSQGVLAHREVIPEDDPWHRPPIDAAEILGAHTPGDVLFSLRSQMQLLPKERGESFTVRFYEGKRLAEITGTYVQNETIDIGEQPVDVHTIKITRKLVNGYTDKEIRRHNEGDPPVFLYLRASDYWPVSMQAKLAFGTLSAQWDEE